MSHTTLDQLERYIDHQRPRRRLKLFTKEIKTIVWLFIAVFVTTSIITNYQLFATAFVSFFAQSSNSTTTINSMRITNTPLTFNADTIRPLAAQTDWSSDLLDEYREVNTLIADYTPVAPSNEDPTATLEALLQEKLTDYDVAFNTLPPQNRLVIPSLDVNSPIINSLDNKSIEEIADGNFDEELFQWVVKYPTTPPPWQKWNTLIFGHTSYYAWENNRYGTIFGWLPRMSNGEIIEIIRWGKLYQYKIIDKVVVRPKDVNREYLKYNNGDYLTLMWCYPLGTTKQRVLIIAERIG